MREIRELDSYQRKLRSFIEEASSLQESYIQLYPQFVTGMLGKIPGAAARFEAIDQQWRNMIDSIRTREFKYSPSALSLIDNDEILDGMIASNKACEEIYSSMEKYILHMRQKCPRLYLLSNSQVLRLLSISKYPSFFDKMLTILFSGVSKFTLIKKVKLEAVESMSYSSSASESQSDAEEYANSGEELSESESVSSEESIERSTHKTVELSVSQAAFGKNLMP